MFVLIIVFVPLTSISVLISARLPAPNQLSFILLSTCFPTYVYFCYLKCPSIIKVKSVSVSARQTPHTYPEHMSGPPESPWHASLCPSSYPAHRTSLSLKNVSLLHDARMGRSTCWSCWAEGREGVRGVEERCQREGREVTEEYK